MNVYVLDTDRHTGIAIPGDMQLLWQKKTEKEIISL